MEHNVDIPLDRTDKRSSRWYAAANKSSATLPLIMTDSGFRWTEASQPAGYDQAYGAMVEQSMLQPPLVRIEAWQRRLGVQTALRVRGRLTNIGTTTLGYDNSATLHLLVIEPVKVIHTGSTVREALSIDVEPDLEPGGSFEFDLRTSDLGRVNMSRLQAVVLVDYRPGDGSVHGYVSANAALASTDVAGWPTDLPPPTATATAHATPTSPPTATLEAEPNTIHLPIAKRQP